jgi:hypothetical protein
MAVHVVVSHAKMLAEIASGVLKIQLWLRCQHVPSLTGPLSTNSPTRTLATARRTFFSRVHLHAASFIGTDIGSSVSTKQMRWKRGWRGGGGGAEASPRLNARRPFQ